MRQLVVYCETVSPERLECFKQLKRDALELLIVAVCGSADRRESVERPSLSTRERQILAMVVMGLTNHQIGARMFLAESTVKSRLSSAYNKLGVRSRSEAVTVITDRLDSLSTGIAAVAPKVELRAA